MYAETKFVNIWGTGGNLCSCNNGELVEHPVTLSLTILSNFEFLFQINVDFQMMKQHMNKQQTCRDKFLSSPKILQREFFVFCFVLENAIDVL